MNTLFYTFRGFPWAVQLPSPFVFGKIKEELPTFLDLVDNIKPNLIIGVAKSPKRYSLIEPKVVNKFHDKKVSREGRGSYDLHMIKELEFTIRKSPTTTFCNYTAYKICEILERVDIKHSFIHIAEPDLQKLANIYA